MAKQIHIYNESATSDKVKHLIADHGLQNIDISNSISHLLFTSGPKLNKAQATIICRAHVAGGITNSPYDTIFLYEHITLAVVRSKNIKTRWDPRVDNKPDNDPRSKFTQIFSSRYLRKANRILDVGCGIGSYIHLIDRQDTFGIDLESQPLKTARKYCMKSDFAVASVLNLPFRNETFDSIGMWEVIEHLPAGTEMQALAEVHRTLAACGTLLLSTPNKHIISIIMDPVYPLGHRHYDVKDLVKFITEIGFSVKHYTIRGSIATLIALNIFYFYKHVFHKKGTKLQKFFDQKSEREFNSKKDGFANIFIAAKKV